MTQAKTKSRFSARLLRPKNPADSNSWAFVVLPQQASARLPRRGRTTVAGTLNGHIFQALLEPDGRKSHWLRVDEALLRESGTRVGDVAQFEIMAVEKEPDPEIPADLARALHAAPDALATWETASTIARVDWIHWVTSARQAKTRTKRIHDACEMLAAGKKTVCCFDSSGVYSKAFRAPQAAD